MDIDKDLTINSKLFVSEHPLFLGEYRQVYKNSNLLLDLDILKVTKKFFQKRLVINHIFFSNFTKNFENLENINRIRN